MRGVLLFYMRACARQDSLKGLMTQAGYSLKMLKKALLFFYWLCLYVLSSEICLIFFILGVNFEFLRGVVRKEIL